jgi:type IV pilus assembly protein PilE
VLNCRNSAGAAPAISRTQAPAEGTAKYNIAVAYPNAQSFTLTATPITADPECGDLTLDQAGTRGITGTGTVANCWR